MWIFDQESLAFLDVNQAAIEIYGYSRQEFLGMTILDIRPPAEVPILVRHTLHPALAGPSTREQWTHKIKGGDVIKVEITSWQVNYQGRAAELVRADKTKS